MKTGKFRDLQKKLVSPERIERARARAEAEVKRTHKNTPRLTNEERAGKLVWDILSLLDTTCSGEEAKSLAKLILKSFQLVSKETLARKKRREG